MFGPALVLAALQAVVVFASHGLPELETKAQWSFHRRQYEYKSYGAITLQRIEVPQHTVALNLTFNAYSDNKKCDIRPIKIFANHAGLPIVSRNGELFPDKAFVSEQPVLNVSIHSDNKTMLWGLANLQTGQLFVMSVMPRKDTRIKQQGLGVECNYFMSLKSVIQYVPEQKLTEFDLDVKNEIRVNKHRIVSFYIPKDVMAYTVQVNGCPDPCPVNVFLRSALSPSVWDEPFIPCQWVNGSCTIQMDYPEIEISYYLGFASTGNTSIQLSVSVDTSYCETSLFKHPRHHSSPPSKKCYLLYHLGRETPAQAEEGSDMYDHFVCMDKALGPHSSIDIKALDTVAAVMGFRLRTSDVGASMRVSLNFPKQEMPTEAQVSLCLTPHRMADPKTCEDGAVVQISSLNTTRENHVLVPYPQSGQWYLAVQSECFDGNSSTSTIVPCHKSKEPKVNITVHLSPCVEGGCGKYGSCKVYFESNILYSSCSCFAGWRGYGCNDGSKADSDGDILLGVYLLTLSNLAFIPGIVLAFYKRHFVEAVVYAFNMFFSTFYHACDTSPIYQLCIMPYSALSFADFFASLLSFWVTLLAMARVSASVRAFSHMIGVMFIAVAVVHNKHGLFEQLVPIAVGVVFVVVSWGLEAYKRRQLYPSKKRLLCFILPGVALACLGLIFNLALETEENYKYMHSLWHCTMATSIVFLLPPRRGDKRQTGNKNLSVQSGDILRDGLLGDEDIQAQICRADEPEGNSEPSSPVSTSRDRGGSFRLTPRDRRRNLIL